MPGTGLNVTEFVTNSPDGYRRVGRSLLRGAVRNPKGIIIDANLRRDEQRLSHSHVAHVLDATTIGFIHFDEAGTIVDCNETVAAMVGLTSRALLGRSFDDGPWLTVHHDGSPFAFGDLVNAKGRARTNARTEVTLGLDTGVGARRWLSVATFPVLEADRHGIIATFTDITDKLLRERLLEIVSEVNRFAMESTNEHDALQHLCDVLVAPGRHALAWIGTSSEGPVGLDVVAAAGATAYLDDGGLFDCANEGWNPIATTLRTGDAHVIHDVEQDNHFSGWRERARRFGFESVATIAFSPGGRRAVLAIFDRHVFAFDEHTSSMLEVIAREVEFAIDHVRSVARLAASLDGTLAALSSITEIRDPYTAGHQNRVGVLGAAIARILGLDTAMVGLIRQAGEVHDVGKTVIPIEILTRPGTLNTLEIEMVKTHCVRGAEILTQANLPWPLAEVAYAHHERLDGSGYPRALVGEEIILPARVIAVADVVEAMVHRRPYREGLGLDAALEAIRSGSGHLFDPDVVDACIAAFDAGFRFAAS